MILSFAIFDLNLNATTLKKVEFFTAYARFPAVMCANIAECNPDKNRVHHFIILLADAVRLANEVLSVLNQDGQYEYHLYDYLWGAYDAKNFVLHLKNLLKNESHFKGSKSESLEEFKELESVSLKIKKLLKSFIVGSSHILALPYIEGLAAIGVSACDVGRIEGAEGKNALMALCSISRLLDSLIMSDQRSLERKAYTILLIANIVIAFGIGAKLKDVEKTYRLKEDERYRLEVEEKRRRVEEERRRAEEEIRRENVFMMRYGGRTEEARDACKVLGIEVGASDREIQMAFLRQSKATHPDKNPNDPLAAEKFKRVIAAKTILLST